MNVKVNNFMIEVLFNKLLIPSVGSNCVAIHLFRGQISYETFCAVKLDFYKVSLEKRTVWF